MIRIRKIPVIFLLSVVWTQTFGLPAKRACAEKEESLALLELAKDSITKTKELVPECKNGLDNSTSHNKSECGLKEKTGAYIDVALKLIDEAKEHYPTCNVDEEPDEPEDEKPDEETKDKTPLPADCQEILESGQKASGVYTIRTTHPAAANKSIDVFCDMTTDGGGWTVIQRRGSFSSPFVDFYRDWNSYKTGFGNLKEEFWLGNDNIFYLTNQDQYSVRFDMQDMDGNKAYSAYGNFKIENEQSMYKLYIDKYSGNAGDSMDYNNAQPFSTKDKNNNGNNCPGRRKSAWWFRDCAYCNPNGMYLQGNKADNYECIFWYHWKNNNGCFITFFEIKLKRRNGKSTLGTKTGDQQTNRNTYEV